MRTFIQTSFTAVLGLAGPEPGSPNKGPGSVAGASGKPVSALTEASAKGNTQNDIGVGAEIATVVETTYGITERWSGKFRNGIVEEDFVSDTLAHLRTVYLDDRASGYQTRDMRGTRSVIFFANL